MEYPDSVPFDIARQLAGATEVYTPQQVEHAVDQLSVRMAVDLQDKNPVFVTVMQGALVFAGMLMRRLIFPCQMGFVRVARYGQATVGGELRWGAVEVPDLQGRVVVLVDDILDEGVTLAALQEWAMRSGAQTALTAVLVERDKPQQPDRADYAALHHGDGFLIGCGMDVAGYGRNLGGIHVLQT